MPTGDAERVNVCVSVCVDIHLALTVCKECFEYGFVWSGEGGKF